MERQILAAVEVLLSAAAAMLLCGFVQYMLSRIDLYRIVLLLYAALSIYCLAAADSLLFIICSIGAVSAGIGVSFAKYVLHANEKAEREWEEAGWDS
ncbi:hypothetical protein [Ectobacillus ponti]|uniref:Uncharacterized protein n=1 Tax=Ectobacillus ponti TaxID=2961894 RepID=A0AA42BPW7_9BACI|nr:hypothetical protein [Ectobacillus ponti]MCP8969640.1 hypothetical protein [Ectobacillus ponti]